MRAKPDVAFMDADPMISRRDLKTTHREICIFHLIFLPCWTALRHPRRRLLCAEPAAGTWTHWPCR